MPEALKILVIDDSEDDWLLYRRSLKKSSRAIYDIRETSTGEEGLDRIDQEMFSCVLLDYSLPGRDGIEILKRIRIRQPFIPVVMLTGLGNETVAVASIREGAQNYIPKAHVDPQTLPHVIEVAIRQCEMQSRIDEQRRSLEVFAHALAHDLKEPVRSIRTLLDVMRPELPLVGNSRDHFQSIRATVEQMNALIDSVYFYTRPDDGERMKREACDGNELVEAAKQNISRLMGERQAVIGCPPLPRLAVNREQIIQVLQHLLSNAIENCPVTPLVALTAEETPGHWSFRVSDNGSGISPPDAEKLFTPFRRLSRQDRHRPGLGLATCQKIIERHGGKIWFQANKAGGADFIFTLPKVEPQDAVWTVHQQAAHASMRPGANKRLATVLLVDDDDLAIDLTQIQLIEANRLRCRVLVAQDGHEALARLRDTQIDLVLLDINMPRMDGFELLDRMRAERMLDRVTVVMCSTSTYEEDISRAKDLGARGYLTKPPNFNRLRSILDSCGRLQILPGADAFDLLCAA